MDNKPITLKKAQKEKNTILIVISFSFALIVIAFLTLYLGRIVEEGILLSFLLIVSLGYLFLISYLRSRYIIASMHYDYLRMIHDDLGLIPVLEPLNTTNLVKNILATGHELSLEYSDFRVFYKLHNKINEIGKTGKVLTLYLVSDDLNFDFYSDKVSQAIELVYQKLKANVSRQIIVQFKPYSTFDPKAKEDMHRIINLVNGPMTIVQLTAGYIQTENSIYYLRPQKRYPNRYYYYATKMIDSVVNLKV